MRQIVIIALLVCSMAFPLAAQQVPQPISVANATAVPRRVTFSGTLRDASALKAHVAGVTFAIYKDEQGGAALWLETQNVNLDAAGRYTVALGATKANGLPIELFQSGEAQWLGITVDGQPEQARVLLLSVPYAMKAADAETIGGLPPSAFVLAVPPNGNGASTGGTATSAAGGNSLAPAVTGSGTQNFVPLWTNSTGSLGNSVMFQLGTGATATVGINTTTPATTLDVKGAATVRGALSLPMTALATATAGKNSQAETFTASAFNSGSKTAVGQLFRLQAEPLGNNTAAPSGTLNLLFGNTAATAAETGLKIASNGQITFAPGQTFPGGGGSGTVTSVALAAPTADFNVTGSPVTSAGKLTLGWKVPPTSANTPNAIVKRDTSGNFDASTVSATTVSATTLNAVDFAVSDLINVNGANFNAIIGQSSSPFAVAISALATATTGAAKGVEGQTNSSDKDAKGVFGIANATHGTAEGVNGVSASNLGIGVLGQGGSNNLSATAKNDIGIFSIGVLGDTNQLTGIGLVGTADDGPAFLVHNDSSDFATAEIQGTGGGDLMIFFGPSGLGVTAVLSNGVVDAPGYITNGGVLVTRVDHPLDPAGKYLTHTAVESSEVLNLYTGNTVLGADGSAAVTLPAWFTALNGDFRYQLTPIGSFAQLYIAEEITGGQFRIAGGRAGMKVSWQVTGIRQDAYAKAHPLAVESDKQGKERGRYINPEVFGQPAEMGVSALQRPSTSPQRRKKLASDASPRQQP